MGPLVIDFRATSLTYHERKLLSHPLVGGVILFARNFENSSQLRALTGEIHSLRPDCLICVDHEGGRVQRFKSDEFTHLPAMGHLGTPQQAKDCGIVMAYELKSHGVHLNFAPVLDKDFISNVIGDRGFSEHVATISHLASNLIDGMAIMGMPACGKHFPGHGSVQADSHVACPIDPRSFSAISDDMYPFIELINSGRLSAVMPAHVVYPEIDNQPAGYSAKWIGDILQNQIGFKGVVFSDDLSMQGASLAGSYQERAISAYQAGCHFLLLCNAPEQIEPVLKALEKVKITHSPDCSTWFTPLPQNAQSIYFESLKRIKRDQYSD